MLKARRERRRRPRWFEPRLHRHGHQEIRRPKAHPYLAPQLKALRKMLRRVRSHVTLAANGTDRPSLLVQAKPGGANEGSPRDLSIPIALYAVKRLPQRPACEL